MIKSSLFAAEEREEKLNKLGDALRVMERHVDFAALAAEIDRVAPRPSRERGGRPPFPTELMARVLLIQQLFNLSDEQMEFQLLGNFAPQLEGRCIQFAAVGLLEGGQNHGFLTP